jgi:hypothetical protein
MIMKLKYMGMLLTSLGLVTAAAAVPAGQDAPQQDPVKLAVPVQDVFSQETAKQVIVGVHPQTPAYVNDGKLPPGAFPYYYGATFFPNQNGEREKAQMAEAALAQEATSLRDALEHAKTDSQRSEARTKLAENLGKQFDLRQKRHGLEIEALETQVKKLKELVRKRQESREDIISRRVDQILREVDGLGW